MRNPLPHDASRGRDAVPAKSDSATEGAREDVIDSYIYSDWNTPSMFISSAGKWGDTMLTIDAAVCALSNITTLFFSVSINKC